LLAGGFQPAKAQLNNQPFSFRGAGGGAAFSTGSVGMTPAYREMILERKLLGRPATNGTFTRGPDGSLVNVDRKGDQVFARAVAAPYALAQGWGGLGFGASAGGGLAVPPYSRAILTGDEETPAIYSAGPGAGVINSWIVQLTNLPELAF
jgi:hypothetical protein